jgi:RND family efflux transporter MFP subunit
VALWALVASAHGCAREEQARANEPATVQVGPEDVAVVRRMSLSAGPTISGSLAPAREAALRSELAGSVLATSAETGQAVRRGQVLARLEAAALQDERRSALSGVRTAQNALSLAQRNQERAAELVEAGAVAQVQLDEARAARSNAQAALAEARARLAAVEERLASATVRAPFDGLVAERAVSAGDVVQPGSPLFTVVDPSSMRLEAAVPADALGALAIGTPVEFTVAGLPGRTFRGRVERINPVADPATRQVRVYVTIPNAARSLVAGLFAEGKVETERREALAAPAAAVDTSGAAPTVTRLDGGRVRHVPVRIGLRDAATEMVELAGGVNEGDRLLMGAAMALSDGTPVTVAGPPAAPAAAP